MGDPNVEACSDRLNQEGKFRCTFKGRPYYFCKTNRKEGVCPKGYLTTYDDPEPKPIPPHYSWFENQLRHFRETHRSDRWNLKNHADAFQLFYQLDSLQFRYLELWMALIRAGKHKEAHMAWGKHRAYQSVIDDIFPYRDGGLPDRSLSDEYRKVQRRIAEIEEKPQ